MANGPQSELITSLEHLGSIVGHSAGHIRRVCEEPNNYYDEFQRKKKNGKLRTIYPPIKPLKVAQRRLLDYLSKSIKWRQCVTGGVSGRSIFDHAEPHVGKFMVATLDVSNFFPRTTTEMVSQALMRKFGLSASVAETISAFTTCFDKQKVRGLPQGSPTSAMLANLVFSEVDIRFLAFARRHKLRYTRYIDDIAISGDENFKFLKGSFIQFITEAKYEVAPDKVHFFPQCERQVITGLVVNERMRPTSEFISYTKDLVKYAFLDEASAEIIADLEGTTVSELKSSIEGRINHVRRFNRKLARRLNSLKYAVHSKEKKCPNLIVNFHHR